jgi:hypothetical protein
MMTSQLQPYREPFRVTLLRTGAIAVIVGGVAAGSRGALSRWPMMGLLALWPALGGHFVELWFLNWVRPCLSRLGSVQAAARLSAWFVGGAGLMLGMSLTAMAMGWRVAEWGAWPALRLAGIGGIGLICIELVVHLVLQLRGRPSFFNGRS